MTQATSSKSSWRGDIVFLLILLAGSLVLNVWLGLKYRSVSALRAGEPKPLTKGDVIAPFQVMSDKGDVTLNLKKEGPIVLYVMSPFCGWCKRNSDNIKALATTVGSKYKFVALNLAAERASTKDELPFPVYGIRPETVAQLHLGVTPQTIVVSGDGHVLENWTGAYSGRIGTEVSQFFGVQLPGLSPSSAR